ncbi:putative holin-like toxin [Secundilactobacillus collinoides]|uniref:putative holin-like toxin n=1 Tax=Secundilactobacillus collinoides TaxID=33960 RepID=UPI0006CF6747|nr:putative holin-like toxin [Secundilactobacillus collinoides]
MSVADALQLMLAFGTFIVALIALIVELIKSQQKNNRLSSGQLAVIKGSIPFPVDRLLNMVIC